MLLKGAKTQTGVAMAAVGFPLSLRPPGPVLRQHSKGERSHYLGADSRGAGCGGSCCKRTARGTWGLVSR